MLKASVSPDEKTISVEIPVFDRPRPSTSSAHNNDLLATTRGSYEPLLLTRWDGKEVLIQYTIIVRDPIKL